MFHHKNTSITSSWGSCTADLSTERGMFSILQHSVDSQTGRSQQHTSDSQTGRSQQHFTTMSTSIVSDSQIPGMQKTHFNKRLLKEIEAMLSHPSCGSWVYWRPHFPGMRQYIIHHRFRINSWNQKPANSQIIITEPPLQQCINTGQEAPWLESMSNIL